MIAGRGRRAKGALELSHRRSPWRPEARTRAAIVRGLVVACDERDEMARPAGGMERCGPRHSYGAVGAEPRVLGCVSLGVGDGSVRTAVVRFVNGAASAEHERSASERKR